MHHLYITSTLLIIAVALTIVCSIGLAIMRDPYQRLQFATPIVSIGSLLIAAAVWVEDPSAQARIKVILIGLILFVTNAILSHSTARAVRIRALGRWEARPEEKIPVAGREGETLS